MTDETLSPDLIKAFVLAGHGDIDQVKQLLAEYPALLNKAHQWSDTDFETALTAAAHTGSREIAEFLLAQGAPLDICTAGMLGRREAVAGMLAANPELAHARGAHGIPLMMHVGLGGDVEVTQMILTHGEQETAVMNATLHMAVARGHTEMAAWLLDNKLADVTAPNSQGKTVLEVAQAGGNQAMVNLLQKYVST